MPVRLNFLWHMHQPDYRTPDGHIEMPWVFLHAIKDYYDMPWILSTFHSPKATFNLTPSLMEQLRIYEREWRRDRFLSLWIEEPSTLSAAEREWVLRICRSSRYDTMVKPLAAFAQLYDKESLDDAQLLDMEVLFILSWCGNYLRRNSTVVRELIGKGSGFDSSDKKRLLDELLSFIPSILPFYGLLQDMGRISVSTTPLNHPILPLLIDMKNASISNPHTQIPANPVSLEDDAREQIDRALKLYEEIFGKTPGGFWPAEGAVDEKSLGLYREYGLGWVATDEAILLRSLESDDRSLIYERYSYEGLHIAFRDHALSNLIAFSYRYKDPIEAASDLLSHIEKIGRSAEGDKTVSIILDGENAWEFYPNNGMDFFEALYSTLESHDTIETATMDELSRLPSKELEKLHPGSWIYGTFDTWVGAPEKNRAWELIFQTHSDYMHHRERLDSETREKIGEEFLIAECSDWFWWYGDDHYTEYSEEFDSLFREHLMKIYEYMGMAAPSSLFRPISRKGDLHAIVIEPRFAITPLVNGRVESFFEWLGSGMIDESKLFSTMDRVRGPIETIHWGEDSENIYIRLDGDMKSWDRIDLYAEETKESFSIEKEAKFSDGYIRAAVDEIVEIAIDKRLFSGKERATLRLEMIKEDIPVQTLPGSGELTIELKKRECRDWFV